MKKHTTVTVAGFEIILNPALLIPESVLEFCFSKIIYGNQLLPYTAFNFGTYGIVILDMVGDVRVPSSNDQTITDFIIYPGTQQ